MAHNRNERDFIERHIDIFCCPRCGESLTLRNGNLDCQSCNDSYAIEKDIPLLFSSNEWDPSKDDVTDKIKSFYEETPFPNYDDFDDVGSLMQKARQGIFAKLLDDQIPFSTRIIEIGCGTGQLTNFLSIANRTVIGTDICLNSLSMASDFKEHNDLSRAHFIQMNLFRPCFKKGAFDLVISNGVLHHTSDPFLGFKTIATLVRPKGYIMIGLYHKYGRIFTNLRRMIFRITNNRFMFLDPRTITEDISTGKRIAWFKDQYKNPYESKHTIGEILYWLDDAGFDFVKSIPKTTPFESFHASERLFEPASPGNWLGRVMVELSLAFSLKQIKEGGFFIVIARKRETG